MSDQFQRTIGDLWASLSLPEPVFAERPSILLTIDTTIIGFEESPDGRYINVRSVAGRLAHDPVVRTMQIRDSLTMNLGSMTSFQASVSIEDEGKPEADVVVSGVYAYEGNRVARLIATLGDVVSLSQGHGQRLQGASALVADYRSTASERARQEDYAMIFRP